MKQVWMQNTPIKYLIYPSFIYCPTLITTMMCDRKVYLFVSIATLAYLIEHDLVL